MKNKIVFASIIFIIVSLYFNFPYDILKENVTQTINERLHAQGIPLILSVGRLRPYLVSGLELEDIKIENNLYSKKDILIEKLRVRFAFFPLFVGKLRIEFHLMEDEGTVDGVSTYSLFSLMTDSPKLTYAEIVVKELPLSHFFTQVLDIFKTQATLTQSFIMPLIWKLEFGGSMTGQLTYVENKPGRMSLSLQEGYLDINNSTLKVPRQTFSSAGVEIEWDSQRIHIRQGSELISQNLELAVNGTVHKTSHIFDANAQARLNVKMTMSGEIQKNFSLILSGILNCQESLNSGNVMSFQLTGPLNQLVCQ